MTREERIMKRVQEHLNELNKRIKQNKWDCEVIGIFLQGSQNYNLDEYSNEYMSDIDTKAIVVPSLKDLVSGHKYSETIVLDNNEHIDVKDIQSMVKCFMQQNATYLELLFTPFKIINPKYNDFMNAFYENKERIARMDAFKNILSTKGSLYNKYKAMCHPAPHSEKIIEKLGYDPKELCHIIRYHSLLKNYILDVVNNEKHSYFNYLRPKDENDNKYLMRVKKGLEYNVNEAKELAYILNNSANVLIQDIQDLPNPLSKDEKIFELLNDLTYEIIRKYVMDIK